MLAVAQSGAPVDFPPSLHLALWPALIVWIAALISLRQSEPRLRSARLGFALVPIAILSAGWAVAASHIWATPAARSLVFAFLWLAVMVSATAYLVLRAPDDEGEDGQDPEAPEPPWWPEFERQLRDYQRQRSQGPSGGPRTPAGTAA
jgi:hypothetical protein